MLFGVPTWFLLVSLSILGAIWGSFVGALCSRWPKGESIATGRSRCEGCAKVIAEYDLVPVVSFLILQGRCRNCGERIRTDTFAIELVAALIGAASALTYPEGHSLPAAIFGWLLLPLVILDYSHFWLPDKLVLLLAIAGFVMGPILLPTVMLNERIMGAFVGYLCLEAVRLVYRKLRGHEGLGAGDPKLFAALGIWLGAEALPLTLLLASAIGLSVGLAARLTTNHLKTVFPLGSYLAVSAFAVSWIEVNTI